MKPTVVSETRRAANAKHNKGKTVTGPAITNQNVIELSPVANTICDDENR